MLQTTHITNKHAQQQRSAFGRVFVCVTVFTCGDAICREYEVLAFCSKQTCQSRAALVSTDSLLSLICCFTMTHASRNTVTAHKLLLLSQHTTPQGLCSTKTFHQTYSKGKYFSPREQQGLCKLVQIRKQRQIRRSVLPSECKWSILRLFSSFNYNTVTHIFIQHSTYSVYTQVWTRKYACKRTVWIATISIGLIDVLPVQPFNIF